ncbi:MAG: hypothetical protein JOZ69_13910 [Myxococcales bacterium]|nr:hypothetical protein [Myxococcales bacterium]
MRDAGPASFGVAFRSGCGPAAAYAVGDPTMPSVVYFFGQGESTQTAAASNGVYYTVNPTDDAPWAPLAARTE